MEYKNNLKNGDNIHTGRKIIPFPGVILNNIYENPVLSAQNINTTVISGHPGQKLPESIPDFRPHLQRNGLILLSWNKRLFEKGAFYRAFWVTSSGILRYYASAAMRIESFPQALPECKSYAAEDGIDFYGETSPLYIVHVAPELMMSSREKIVQRPIHIKKLKELGIQVNFNYTYLLTREKKRRSPETTRGA